MSINRHRMTRRQMLGVSATTATTFLATPSILKAQSATVLNFSSWLPAASLITENMFVPWADEIESLTDGRVRMQILPRPLGPPPAHLDLLQSGEADVGYSVHGYSKGEFMRAKIGQFSFLGDAYGASHAFSKVYGQLLDAEDEHQGIKMLGLFQHGPGLLMLKNKVIRTADDYKGLRIRTSGGYIGDLMRDLGAENVPMSPTAVKQALIDGVIDGAAFPYEAGPAFDFVDQISYISEVPNGYYNSTWFLGMSKQAAARISIEDFAAIKDYSATTVHVLAAKAFDYADYLGKEAFEAAGVEIERAPPEVLNHVTQIATGYETQWSAEVSATGYDGERALAFTRRMTNGG